MAPSYVSQVLQPMPLAPEIMERILDGRQPAELQLDDLLQGLPLEWAGQGVAFLTLLSAGLPQAESATAPAQSWYNIRVENPHQTCAGAPLRRSGAGAKIEHDHIDQGTPRRRNALD